MSPLIDLTSSISKISFGFNVNIGLSAVQYNPNRDKYFATDLN